MCLPTKTFSNPIKALVSPGGIEISRQ